MKKILKNNGVQSFLASIICILVGMLIGYIALLVIDPSGAGEAIVAIAKNFLGYSRDILRMKNFANTVVKSAPLLMCALSILFSYKVGLFNIGAAGQYVLGSCAGLYAALIWKWSWIACVLFAALAGAFLGMITGILKAYCNVNEVISGIMLNWIALYFTNTVLSKAKDGASAYTYTLAARGKKAILPTLGLSEVFKSQYFGVAIIFSIIIAVVVWVVLDKTKFGYELKATGYNVNAAKYCGMAERRNIILSLVISGVLAGLAGSFLYLTDIEQWQVTVSTVPAMGFNGIAASFLGGLNPIGTIFASFFIQHITDGGSHVDLSVYCSQISELISAIIIYLCAFVGFLKLVFNKYASKERKPKNGGAK